MAQKKITQFSAGTALSTDVVDYTDVQDTSSAATGTTKKYTRTQDFNFTLVAMGFTVYTEVIAASTVALTVTYANGVSGVGATLTNAGVQAAFALDGVTLTAGQRVLIKNQASAVQNGIYTVTVVGSASTNWVLTRATDFDQSAEIVQWGVVLVQKGTVSANLAYQQTTATPIAIGTNDITFALMNMDTLINPVPGTAGTFIRSDGTAWQTSTTTIANSFAQYSIAYASSANALTGFATVNGGSLATNGTGVPVWVSNPGASNKMYQSTNGGAPVWSTATYPATATATGTILRANGTNWVATTSTFADTYAASTILYSNGANTVTGLATANSAVLRTNASGVPAWSASMTNGQVIIGSTGGTPAAATITAGANISITNAANSITIASNGGSGYVWTEVTGVSQNMAVDNGYIANNAGVVSLALPTTSAVGDTVAIVGKGAGGWSITQAAGQQINIGNVASTLGAGGSVSSTNQWNSVELVCVTANTIWAAFGGAQGNLTIV